MQERSPILQKRTLAKVSSYEYNHIMSMKKRLQVPITSGEEKLFKSAAQVYSIPAAEWARRVLRKAAERDLATDLVLDPLEAVKRLGELNAPVADVSQMSEESLKGRIK